MGIDRRSGLGGTDVAAICGLDSRRSAFDVYLEKRGEMPPAPPSDRMWAGKKLERAIAEMYEERTHSAIAWCDRTRINQQRSWQVFTPDFLAFPGFDIDPIFNGEEWRDDVFNQVVPAELTPDQFIGGDAKNVAWDQQWLWGDEGTDQVPDRIACQCHYYISASGCPEWHVAALFGGHDFRIYIIKRDEEIEGILLQEAEKFWNDCVIGGRMPDIKATNGAARYLKVRFPNNSGKLRVPTGEEGQLLEEYRLARKEAMAALSECDDLEARVKLAIGDDDGFQFGDNRVTYRKTKDTMGVDWKALSHALYHHLQGWVNGDPSLMRHPASLEALEKQFACVTREGTRRMDCRPRGEW